MHKINQQLLIVIHVVFDLQDTFVMYASFMMMNKAKIYIIVLIVEFVV